MVELGHLEVTGISATSAADERRLIFGPTNRTDGIDLSADPICWPGRPPMPSPTTGAAKASEGSLHAARYSANCAARHFSAAPRPSFSLISSNFIPPSVRAA